MDTSATITEDDVEEIIKEVDMEAAEHGGDYAAGMRRARLIVEESLKEKIRGSNEITIELLLSQE